MALGRFGPGPVQVGRRGCPARILSLTLFHQMGYPYMTTGAALRVRRVAPPSPGSIPLRGVPAVSSIERTHVMKRAIVARITNQLNPRHDHVYLPINENAR